MKTLENLAWEISDNYASILLEKGPMHVFMKECATGYLHSFLIRGLCAHYQQYQEKRWFEAAKSWADLSIRLQGSYGDPAAYNMGYLYETENGIPDSWFVADTTDQATALLNIAYLLPPSDPLYIRLLDSLLKFDSYIQQWNLNEKGFALGYMNGENLDKESYHCAVARCISYYSAMYLVFGKQVYLNRGKLLVNHMLELDDFNSNYHGAPSTNRCYASYALLDAYYVIAKHDDNLKQHIIRKFSEEIVPWAIENQTKDGFWAHDRFGDQPGSAKVIDHTKAGPYSWGILYGLECYNKLVEPQEDLVNAIEKSYNWLTANLQVGDINRWGYHCWATTASAAKLYPENFFPMKGNAYEEH